MGDAALLYENARHTNAKKQPVKVNSNHPNLLFSSLFLFTFHIRPVQQPDKNFVMIANSHLPGEGTIQINIKIPNPFRRCDRMVRNYYRFSEFTNRYIAPISNLY